MIPCSEEMSELVACENEQDGDRVRQTELEVLEVERPLPEVQPLEAGEGGGEERDEE